MLTWILAFGLAPVMDAAPPSTASALNRTAVVRPDGRFLLRNLPSAQDFRVTVVRYGAAEGAPPQILRSAPFSVPDGGPHSVDGLVDVTSSTLDHLDVIELTAAETTLAGVAGSAQLPLALVGRADSATVDLLQAGGAWFRTSNPAVATVDAAGVVTARGDGVAAISARFDELVATVLIDVQVLADRDGDTLPDAYELAEGLNPDDPTDAPLDLDADGLSALVEYARNTRPAVADTDGDGFSDGAEVTAGTNPLDPLDYPGVAPLALAFDSDAIVMVLNERLLGEATRAVHVFVTNTAGGVLEVDADVTVASGPTGGLEIVDGTLSAYAPGNYTLTAAAEGLTATATVTVAAFDPFAGQGALARASVATTALSALAGHGDALVIGAGTNGARRVDLGSDGSLTVAGTYGLTGTITQLARSGSHVFAATATSIYDLDVGSAFSTKAVPVWYSGTVDAVAATADSVYVATTSGSNSRVDRVLRATKAAAQSVSLPKRAMELAADQDDLVVCYGDQWLDLIDTLLPTPAVTTHVNLGAVTVRSVAIHDRWIFAAGPSLELAVLDRSTGAVLGKAASATAPISADLAASGTFVFSADERYANHIPVWDLLAGSSPALRGGLDLTSFGDPDGKSVWALGRLVAVGQSNGELHVAEALRFVDDGLDAPSLTISAPGATVPAGAAWRFAAVADDDVAVKEVRFYAAGVLLEADRSAPYETSAIAPSVDGPLALEAVAVDFAGHETRRTVTVTVSSTLGPAVVIESPVEGEAVPAGGALVLAASAQPATWTRPIASVVWREDGAVIATNRNRLVRVAPAAADTVTYSVTVTDSAGNATTASRTVPIGPPSTTSDLVIDGRVGVVSQPGSYGTIAVLNGGVLTAPQGVALELTAARIEVDATSSIDVSGQGLRGGLVSGNPFGALGETIDPVTGQIVAGSGGNNGGAHAGSARQPSLDQPVASPYGSFVWPLTPGGGGGANGSLPGGSGGGVLRLTTADLVLDGALRANGTAGVTDGCSPTGAGGSIAVAVSGTFSGAGTVQADAGNGGSCRNGGGGGRVAIRVTGTSAFTGTMTAKGTGESGAGTVLVVSPAAPLGALAINADGSAVGGETPLREDAAITSVTVGPGATVVNEAQLSARVITTAGTTKTVTNDGVWSMDVYDTTNIASDTVFTNRGQLNIASDALLVRNGTTFVDAGTIGLGDSVGSLDVRGVLTHEAGDARGVSLTVRGNATIGSAGRVTVLGLGLAGGSTGGAFGERGVTLDAATGVPVAGAGLRSGGSHGGRGADDSPASYGDYTDPTALGGGGGGGLSDAGKTASGGAGGGRVDLRVQGNLSVSGWIDARGADGATYGAGGGAGGSIRLEVGGQLTGTGSIMADGGVTNGTSSAALGGAGGGGRIAILGPTAVSGFTGRLTAFGGATETPGRRGTVLVKLSGDAIGSLWLWGTQNPPTTTLSLDEPGVDEDVALPSDGWVLRTVRVDLADGLPGGGTRLEVRENATVALSGVQSLELVVNGGTVTSDGWLTVPTFDAAHFAKGTFVNRGRLDVVTGGLVVTSGMTLVEAGTIGADDVTPSVDVSGILTHDAEDPLGLGLTVTGAMTVKSSGKVDASGLGLPGGDVTLGTVAETLDPVTLAVVPGADAGCGGSHGGVGGVSSAGGAVAPVYGDADAPTTPGGGGGQSPKVPGGAGGGVIALDVGSLSLEGAIQASGARGGSTSGLQSAGGAGGSVNLVIHGAFSGKGQLRADGAYGYQGGGSGGGGRIRVRCGQKTFTGTVTVDPGPTYPVNPAVGGAPGTMTVEVLP